MSEGIDVLEEQSTAPVKFITERNHIYALCVVLRECFWDSITLFPNLHTGSLHILCAQQPAANQQAQIIKAERERDSLSTYHYGILIKRMWDLKPSIHPSIHPAAAADGPTDRPTNQPTDVRRPSVCYLCIEKNNSTQWYIAGCQISGLIRSTKYILYWLSLPGRLEINSRILINFCGWRAER